MRWNVRWKTAYVWKFGTNWHEGNQHAACGKSSLTFPLGDKTTIAADSWKDHFTNHVANHSPYFHGVCRSPLTYMIFEMKSHRATILEMKERVCMASYCFTRSVLPRLISRPSQNVLHRANLLRCCERPKGLFIAGLENLVTVSSTLSREYTRGGGNLSHGTAASSRLV